MPYCMPIVRNPSWQVTVFSGDSVIDLFGMKSISSCEEKLSVNLVSADKFVQNFAELMDGYTRHQILNCDETGLYYKMFFVFVFFMHFCLGMMTTHTESINSDLQRGLDRRLRHTQH